MTKPKIIVLSGYGLNCEEETKFAFDLAGGQAAIVHINDLVRYRFDLDNFQILAIPGGFSYGDDTGSGNAYACKLRNHLWEDLLKFISKDKLVIGICNGFQILVNLGLLPAVFHKYGVRQVGLMHNKQARYCVRFVDLKVKTENTPWLKGIKNLSLPVANGEGRLYIPDHIMTKLKDKKMIALKYFSGEMCNFLSLPANPNGSIDDIAGLIDETGKIFGLMPHPERAMFFSQMPNWLNIKDNLNRSGKNIPLYGPGIDIFRNAVNYFLER